MKRAFWQLSVCALAWVWTGLAADAGLLANWKLDEGSGTSTVDATGNGHTGTLQNGPSWVTGLASNALNFTGDKRVEATAVGDLNLTNALTLSVWIKPTGPGYGPPSYSIFFAKGNPYFSGWGLYYRDTRQILFQMTGQNGNSISTAGVLPTNLWTHVVVTFDGTKVRLYLNGLPDRMAVWSGARLTNTTAVTIGALGGSNQDLPGAIDEARVYDTALSETEIARLFLEQDRDRDRLVDANEALLGTDPDNPDSDGDGWPDGLEVAAGTDPLNASSHPDLSTGLVGWWKLDEGTGTTTTDSGSGGNNGTLYNGPQWISGVASNGLQFDGVNDYVACGATGSGSALAVTNLTMSYWMLTPNLEQWATMLERRVGETGYAVWWQQGYERVIPWLPGIPVVQLSFSDMNTNQWHLHTFTYDRQKVRSYLDGIERTNATYTNALLDAQDRLYIGEGHAGKMDDVRVYNRALSAGDVAALALMDSDGDGLPDAQETRLGTNPNNADSDGDGLSDSEEILLGTSPTNRDTDGDGVDDYTELLQGRDPTRGAMSDTTGLVNLTVYTPLE